MAYCPNCGVQLLEGAKFCHYCGTKVMVTNFYNTVQNPVYSTYDTTKNDYRIVMIRRGTCSKTNARELLMDIFGYTTPEANTILDSLPMEIACNLTFQQAVYAAQALTEYGIELSVLNSDGYTDINRYAGSSVYNNNGSFLSNVLSVLGTLTVANRLRNLTQWNRPVSYTFRPSYVRQTPPEYIRHKIRPEPEPPVPPRPIMRRDEPLHHAVNPNHNRPSSSNNNTAINRAPRSEGPRPEGPHHGEQQSIKKGGR